MSLSTVNISLGGGDRKCPDIYFYLLLFETFKDIVENVGDLCELLDMFTVQVRVEELD